ncbi:SH2 domain-containing protein 7 [Mastacembelus armatus]|uniref:SH2 domain containing 7 n=1 Tax=Mastacembelus armatus TaxID=205130 RepID=A0A3Q3LLX2_9TELE|nr:SH2 domain-containing protein 7 [Mastacembelus armatus]
MTIGSNHTVLMSRREIERRCSTLYRQEKSRSGKICHYSGSRTKVQKTSCLRSCLMFCFKAWARMDHKEPQTDALTEGTEGQLRELASKWFIETQVPLLVHNGFFPNWFKGFISRKNAEEILREKQLGCFLIRLSDKAIGYILSYRGRDRCRHFVINQNEIGHFVVSGDNEEHHTVSDLVEYYKTSPIEPFGEYLTSSCSETPNEDLYDIIQVGPKEIPVVKAVKNMKKQPSDLASEHPPTRPQKINRTLEEVPPLPRRTWHFDASPQHDKDNVLYAQLKKQSPSQIPKSQPICQDHLPRDNPGRAQLGKSTTCVQNISRCSPSGPDSVYTALSHVLEQSSKSRSLPFLGNCSEGEQYYKLSAPTYTPPRLSPQPTRQATGGLPRSKMTDSRLNSSNNLDYMNDNAIYHLAGRPSGPHTTSSENRPLTSQHYIDSVYSVVSSEALPECFSQDNTYELIPEHEDTAHTEPKINTYEPLEDIRPKVVKNDRRKWLFSEAKRKW